MEWGVEKWVFSGNEFDGYAYNPHYEWFDSKEEAEREVERLSNNPYVHWVSLVNEIQVI